MPEGDARAAHAEHAQERHPYRETSIATSDADVQRATEAPVVAPGGAVTADCLRPSAPFASDGGGTTAGPGRAPSPSRRPPPAPGSGRAGCVA